MPEFTKPVSLSDLIYWVKQELLSEEAKKKDPVPLFTIDEVTVEVNFVADAKVKAGVTIFKVVELGGEVGGQAVQKATIKMSPIIKREQIISKLQDADPEIMKIIEEDTYKAIFKGKKEEKEITPSR